LQLDRHKIAAVGSRDAGRARAFADRFDIPASYGSYEEVAADPNVGIVYVATPHSAHLSCALMAIEAGKSVLIEKPLTLNAGQARVIVQAAAQAGVACMEAMWTRFLPQMVHLRQVIADGLVGSIVGLIADHSQDLPSDPHHRLNDLALGGGALLDLGVYPISFSYDLFGAPSRITVRSSTLGPTGADRSVAVHFSYQSSAQAFWTAASDTAGPNNARVIGDRGSIELDRVWFSPTTMRTRGVNSFLERFDGATPGRGMQFQAREMERLTAAGLLESDIMPLGQSVSIMETMDQIRAEIGVRYPADSAE
jgi:predicted dehydrogenase